MVYVCFCCRTLVASPKIIMTTAVRPILKRFVGEESKTTRSSDVAHENFVAPNLTPAIDNKMSSKPAVNESQSSFFKILLIM